MIKRDEVEQALRSRGPMPIGILAERDQLRAESDRLRAESDLWLKLYRGDIEAFASLVAAGLL